MFYNYTGKENGWDVYTGKAEYYVSRDYPTLYSVFRRYVFPSLVPNDPITGEPRTKIWENVTIKKQNNTYNVFLSNTAFGFILLK